MGTQSPDVAKRIDPAGPDEPIAKHMERHGIDRRTVLRWSAYMAGILALPVIPYAAKIAAALDDQPRLPVLWLNGQDCAGDTEGFLRASRPTPSELVLDYLSLDYAETLMAPAGDAAEARYAETLKNQAGKYVLVVEGSIPTGASGAYCTVGGRAFADIVKEAAAGALAIIAVGSCAADGGLAAATGGITDAVAVKTLLAGTTTKILNFPGCPMNIENLTAAIVQYLTLGAWPDTNADGLPLFAYGARVHSTCERLPFLRAGKVALDWGDEGHRAGWCLRRIGCQGPTTYVNCSVVKFNEGTSWPVSSGSPCIGCTQPNFWDSLQNVVNWVPTAQPPPTNPSPSPSTPGSASPSAPGTPSTAPPPSMPPGTPTPTPVQTPTEVPSATPVPAAAG